jgi:3-hydroxyisobutyrate dehydrogenase-like beta-hydroxyacid dehydrogenase
MSDEVAVGLCGCGNMGGAIAARLGPQVSLTVFDVDAERRSEVARAVGGVSVDSVSKLAALASYVVLSLPNAEISATVIRELVATLKPGSVIIETSTVSPSDVVASHSVCRAAGIHLVDAAILSGVAQMRDGSSTLLIGGDSFDVDAASSVLELVASDRIRLGGPGTGMAAKVGNNAVSHAVMIVLAEAISMVAAAGVPMAVFAELLARPDAGLIRPLTHRIQERVASGDFEGGMPMEAARKDSVLALQLAQRHGIPLFAIQAAHVPYEIAIAEGMARDDYAGVVRLWEKWLGTSFADDGKSSGAESQ